MDDAQLIKTTVTH